MRAHAVWVSGLCVVPFWCVAGMCACVLLSCINHTTAAAAPVTGWLAQFCAGLLLFGHWRCCCVCCWHGGTTRCIKRLWPCVMAQASAGSAGCLSPWRHAYRCSWLNVCIILYVSSTRRRAAALRLLAHLLLLTTWLCALLVRQHSQLYSLRSRGLLLLLQLLQCGNCRLQQLLRWGGSCRAMC